MRTNTEIQGHVPFSFTDTKYTKELCERVVTIKTGKAEINHITKSHPEQNDKHTPTAVYSLC